MIEKYKLIVLTNSVEGQDEAFNRWYDGIHLSDVLKITDFVAAQRFQLVGNLNSEAVFRYCAIYDVVTEDPVAALDRLRTAAGSPAMQISDTLATPLFAALYRELGHPVRA